MTMRIIEELVDFVDEEIDGAEEYAKLAVKFKSENPTLAKTYYDISMDELKHVDLLHAEVVKLIEEHRKNHGEPPASMMAVYDYLHEKHIEEVKEVRMYQAQFRGV